MVDFQCPEILDPDVALLNPRRIPVEDLPFTNSPTLEDRFRKACEYGRALWSELAETRRYLRDEVAGSESVAIPTGAHQAMLPTTQSWQEWAVVYERICKTLAGISGDSGFGRSEATLIARSHGVEIQQPTD